MGNISVAPRSRKELELIANRFRKLCNCTQLYFPIVELIEILGEPDSFGRVIVNNEIVADHEMPEEYAEYAPLINTIRIRESVYLGAHRGNGRDRFTLAHELGHAILLGGADCKYSRSQGIIPAYRDPEWQANTLASYLLMPRQLISGMDASTVALKCGTSLQAAQIALKK